MTAEHEDMKEKDNDESNKNMGKKQAEQKTSSHAGDRDVKSLI